MKGDFAHSILTPLNKSDLEKKEVITKTCFSAIIIAFKSNNAAYARMQ